MTGNDGDHTLSKGQPWICHQVPKHLRGLEKLPEPIPGPFSAPSLAAMTYSIWAQPGQPWREKPGEFTLPSRISEPSSQAPRVMGKDAALVSVPKDLRWPRDWNSIRALMSLECPSLRASPCCQALYTWWAPSVLISTSDIGISILPSHIRQLELREVKLLAPGHTAERRWRPDFIPRWPGVKSPKIFWVFLKALNEYFSNISS